MAARAASHANAMNKIEWDQDNWDKSKHMEVLAKETNTLYKVLKRCNLSESIIDYIVQSVLQAYKEEFGK